MPIFRLSAGGLGYFADIPGCGGGATIRSLEVRFGPLAFYDPLHTETPPAAGRGPRLSMLAGRRCSGCFRPASSRRPSPWCAIRSTGCGRSTCSSGRSRARSRRRRASASGSRTSPSGRSMSPPSSTMPADGRPRAQGRRDLPPGGRSRPGGGLARPAAAGAAGAGALGVSGRAARGRAYARRCRLHCGTLCRGTTPASVTVSQPSGIAQALWGRP